MLEAALARAQARPREPELVGSSDAIGGVQSAIESAARSDAKVLLTGETGVGKDVVANLIHRRSSRRAGRFVTINCAGVPDSLLESELFGHVRGAFTDAYRDKPGLFEQAHHGTVFLDEVGEMSMRMQAALLRFLESGELQRVGASSGRTTVSVRVIAATNRDPRADVAAGAFREDLYYRLNVISIHVPPLRERQQDIEPIFDYWLRLCAADYGVRRPMLSPEALAALQAYHWPGNVRQLRNVVEQLVLKGVDRSLEVRDLPPEICRPPASDCQASAASPTLERERSEAMTLLNQMLERGECFWSVVYPPFIKRDLPRAALREIVAGGLSRTMGNYRALVGLFNMPASDYKRFMTVLRKHDCAIPFRPYRVVRGRELVA
jgi:transcriptional regulator with PAS, ATPase and Fis domain